MATKSRKKNRKQSKKNAVRAARRRERLAKKVRLKRGSTAGSPGKVYSQKIEVLIARNPNAKLRGRQVEACLQVGKELVCASGANPHAAEANAFTKTAQGLRKRRSALSGLANRV